MSNIKGIGANGEIAQVSKANALRVEQTTPGIDPDEGGRYRLSVLTGALSGVAAGGAILGFLNPSSSRLCLIDRIVISAQPVADATGQQRLGFVAAIARGFTDQFDTGGGAVDLSGDQPKKRTSHADSTSTAYYSSSTTAISGETITDEAEPIIASNGHVPDAGVTIANPPIDAVFDARDGNGVIVLAEDEGLVIRNGPVAMGAALTCVVLIEIEWREVLISEAVGL